MSLTSSQQFALDKINKWLKSSTQCFYLAGYAGSGKTFLLQHFINSLSRAPLCVCPTGKAASVLQKKLTNAIVGTIHSKLYCPVTPNEHKLEELIAALIANPENKILQEAVDNEKRFLAEKGLNFSLNDDHGIQVGELVICDEASMVTGKIHSDLCATGAKILFVGDPMQLPPVKDSGFFDVNTPDVMLTEVQRQALENPILKLAMQVRKGEEPDYNFDWSNEHGICRRIPRNTLDEKSWLCADQVITGKNITRQGINKFFRNKLIRSGWVPKDGEKLVCLKNSKYNGMYFINGVQATAVGSFTVDNEFNTLTGNVLWEGILAKDLPIYSHPLESHYNASSVEEPYSSRDGLVELDFAYAITCHKSQGSEFDNVIIADDQMQINNYEFRKRWLYTACTRAVHNLTWIF
jgi:exodeoxyribonuclease V